MKKLLALLLALCLPLCALANQERITSFTEAEHALVSAHFDALLEMTPAGEGYPACCESMTEEDRLLFVVILYDSYIRSGGLCDFLLDNEPEMLADVPAALRLIGAEAQAEMLEAFLEENAVDSLLFDGLGLLNRNWARTLYPFEAFDEAMLALDMETALVTLIAQHISSAN